MTQKQPFNIIVNNSCGIDKYDIVKTQRTQQTGLVISKLIEGEFLSLKAIPFKLSKWRFVNKIKIMFIRIKYRNIIE